MCILVINMLSGHSWPQREYRKMNVLLFELLRPLWCVTDGGVIHVQAALYGRADKETCSEDRPPQQLHNIQCSQKGVLEVFKRKYSDTFINYYFLFCLGKTRPDAAGIQM